MVNYNEKLKELVKSLNNEELWEGYNYPNYILYNGKLKEATLKLLETPEIEELYLSLKIIYHLTKDETLKNKINGLVYILSENRAPYEHPKSWTDPSRRPFSRNCEEAGLNVRLYYLEKGITLIKENEFSSDDVIFNKKESYIIKKGIEKLIKKPAGLFRSYSNSTLETIFFNNLDLDIAKELLKIGIADNIGNHMKYKDDEVILKNLLDYALKETDKIDISEIENLIEQSKETNLDIAKKFSKEWAEHKNKEELTQTRFDIEKINKSIERVSREELSLIEDLKKKQKIEKALLNLEETYNESNIAKMLTYLAEMPNTTLKIIGDNLFLYTELPIVNYDEKAIINELNFIKDLNYNDLKTKVRTNVHPTFKTLLQKVYEGALPNDIKHLWEDYKIFDIIKKIVYDIFVNRTIEILHYSILRWEKHDSIFFPETISYSDLGRTARSILRVRSQIPPHPHLALARCFGSTSKAIKDLLKKDNYEDAALVLRASMQQVTYTDSMYPKFIGELFDFGNNYTPFILQDSKKELSLLDLIKKYEKEDLDLQGLTKDEAQEALNWVEKNREYIEESPELLSDITGSFFLADKIRYYFLESGDFLEESKYIEYQQKFPNAQKSPVYDNTRLYLKFDDEKGELDNPMEGYKMIITEAIEPEALYYLNLAQNNTVIRYKDNIKVGELINEDN